MTQSKKRVIAVDIQNIKKRIEKDGKIMGQDKARKAAVLIPLIKTGDKWDILFEVRSKRLKKQPGDICFPGGRLEKNDVSLQNTAVRETYEELGIDKSAIEVIGKLGTCIPTPELFIYPYVGVVDGKSGFSPNPDEVEEIFTVPLSWLMKQRPEKHSMKLNVDTGQDFPFERIAFGKNYPFRQKKVIETFYEYNGKTIWGLTARILEHFITLMNCRAND